jgi:Fusaric acid resistance protein family
MSGTSHRIAELPLRFRTTADNWSLAEALRTAWPPLLFGLRLWASVSLALYAAFWLQLDNPFWAGASAAIVCQPQLGASLRKGWFRMLGTLVGAILSAVLVACFSQDRFLFLACLTLWAAVCAFFATLLRNFASYAASLAGYTAAIIVGDLLGTVGGIDANAAFLLAVSRASAICLGIACAGIVLAGTDLGGARRRLAGVVAELAGGITSGLVGTLTAVGNKRRETRAVQREFLRRAIALDPIVDQALGESSQVRYHSPALRRAVDGLFSALAGWYAVADHLARLPGNEAHRAATTLFANVPQELRMASERDAVALSLTAPIDLYRICEIAAGRFASLPTGTPSLQLLAEKIGMAFTGLVDALNGLALLVEDSARPASRRSTYRLRVPDWLPVKTRRTLTPTGRGIKALILQDFSRPQRGRDRRRL